MPCIVFDRFCLDTDDARLRRDGQAVILGGKNFALLHYLAQHPGRLVTKEELLDAVWAGRCVGDAVLKVGVREVRRALDDDPKTPRFIETVHGLGYRFIGATRLEDSQSDRGRTPDVAKTLLSPGPIGRETELERLHDWFAEALSGTRRVVFVTGEAGIGKTTLVESFVARATAQFDAWAAQGHCLEHFGAGEAYLPVLDALGRLCRTPGRERLIALLRDRAPAWLAQMPWLTAADERERLEHGVFGTTRERMLRELCELFEALTAETPLILLLEDLHWGDHASLALISFLARRQEPARLLLIATYRPEDLGLDEHPLKTLKTELELHRQCRELPLGFLSESAVTAYLTARLAAGREIPSHLAALVRLRTEGNPLFMVNVLEYWLAERMLVQSGDGWLLHGGLTDKGAVPENITQMIEKRIERLGPQEQRILEAASVAGAEFSAAAVANALDDDPIRVEESCVLLARRRQFLQCASPQPRAERRRSARFDFIHALYHEVLYQRLCPARRTQFHQRLGQYLESVYRERACDVSAKLAMHFEQGHDFSRAVRYLQLAAVNATHRYANHEAIDHLTHALALSEKLAPEERPHQLISLREQRAHARRTLTDMRGAVEDFDAVVQYAREQCRPEVEAQALVYLAIVLAWVDHEACLAVVKRLEVLSQAMQDPTLQVYTRGWAGYWHLLCHGWRDEDADACAAALEASRSGGDQAQLGLLAGRFSYFKTLRSEYGEANLMAAEGGRCALESGNPFEYMLSLFFRAWALLHQGEWGEMRRILEAGVRAADKNSHYLWAVLLRFELAWLHLEAFDFECARTLCDQGLSQAQEARHPYGQLLGSTLLGLVYLGLGDHLEAARRFEEISEQLRRERVLMDWIVRLPLLRGLCTCRLAQGRWRDARIAAERLNDIAGACGERTYLALGHCALGQAAWAVQDAEGTDREFAEALATLEGVEAPLAEWRVCMAVGEVHAQRGRAADAARHRGRGAAVIERLASSLESGDPLARSLLGHPEIRPVLAHAHRWDGERPVRL
jgi:DNA-binding winged helix-turn-helix (wHTH) protein